MAKKVVATLKKGTGKDFSKVIRVVRSEKTGAYYKQELFVCSEKLFVFLLVMVGRRDRKTPLDYISAYPPK